MEFLGGPLGRSIRALVALLSLPLAAALPAHGAESGMELGRIKVKTLQETSGIAASRQNTDILWMHNDGEGKRIYAVKLSGKVAAQLRVPDVIKDLEDMAVGPGPEEGIDYLYLGDIGDNERDRREVQVVRFAEPAINGNGQLRAEGAEVFQLRFPNGSHDAEALLVDPIHGDIVIVTKEEDRARVFMASAGNLQTGETAKLQLIAELEVNQISAGDISRDGSLIALRREDRGWLWQRHEGETIADALAKRPREIPVRGSRQGDNGESLAFAADGRSYFTISEGKNERLYAFPVPGESSRLSE
jgi:hypothetical protein